MQQNTIAGEVTFRLARAASSLVGPFFEFYSFASDMNKKHSLFGGLPPLAVKFLVAGLIWFLLLNVIFALHLFTTSHEVLHNQESLPANFLKLMWWNHDDKESKKCPTYGCPIYPEEYQTEIVQRALQKRQNSTSFAAAFDVHNPTYATLTRTSNRKEPPFNQDAAIAIVPYETRALDAPSFFIGIFDGHGAEGHTVAQHFRSDIPHRLAQRLNPNNQQQEQQQSIPTDAGWIRHQIYKTVVESDKEADFRLKMRGGCTASFVVRHGPHLLFSNTGDSRTVLLAVHSKEFKIVERGAAPGVTELYSTRLDKANLPDEKSRIEAGTVMDPIWQLAFFLFILF